MSVHRSLEVSGRGLNSYFPGFTTLDCPYDAYPVICSNAHLETIFATKFRSSPYVRFRRECIRAKDNGVFALDWVAGDDRCLSPKSPILFLLEGDRCLLSGAVSLCNAFNVVLAVEELHKGFNKVYDRILGASLSKVFSRHALLFEGIEGDYNISIARNSRSCRDFDESYTRVAFGLKSADDFYQKLSSSDAIKNVCRPLLCIQAANDPMAPIRGIPHEAIEFEQDIDKEEERFEGDEDGGEKTCNNDKNLSEVQLEHEKEDVFMVVVVVKVVHECRHWMDYCVDQE
nr:hypothetical protein [Tanacetum cinerariifolium]